MVLIPSLVIKKYYDSRIKDDDLYKKVKYDDNIGGIAPLLREFTEKIGGKIVKIFFKFESEHIPLTPYVLISYINGYI